MKRQLSMGLAAALAASAAIVACASDEQIDLGPGPEPPTEEAGAVLPAPSNPEGGSVDASKDGSKDGAVDAAKDAGPPPPNPGDKCPVLDAITARTCGKCGKQETICQPADGGLAWTEYGPCTGEAGECLPGATRACGNCGTQTCNTFCAWAACGGEPLKSCAPGSVDFTTAGCPSGGFKTRTCSAACAWQPYSLTCESPKAVNLWSTGPGAYSTFMRGNNGNVYAWGLDADGQLGDGTTTNKSKMVPTPFSNVVSMAIGGGTTYGFSCAAFGDGTGKCWGYISTSYTLGDGVTSTSLTGVTPTGFNADLVSVAAGYGHGCGLFLDGSAACWGYNTYGQLGNGSTTTTKTPVTVTLVGITQIYSGQYTVCARTGDAAYCWGYNTYGQVGDGTTTNRPAPTLVIPSGVASLARPRAGERTTTASSATARAVRISRRQHPSSASTVSARPSRASRRSVRATRTAARVSAMAASRVGGTMRRGSSASAARLRRWFRRPSPGSRRRRSSSAATNTRAPSTAMS
jgi:hypothetical protein